MQALLDAIAHMAPSAGAEAGAGADTDAQRVFHGRGGLHPGCEHLALDCYPPVWVLTSFLPLTDDELAQIHHALAQRWADLAPGETLNWVYQCRQPSSAQGTETRLMAGAVPEPHVVTEDGARYAVHVLRGQNHGLFLDMAEGRRWLREQATAHVGPGLKVLNLFAYTCAFSVAALQGGARLVLNVDMSQGAIAIGQHNHGLNGVQGRARFMAHDIFSTWGKITRSGPYDVVVVDPPSYQKGSFVATKDYARLMRRLPDLLVPGGRALLCLNAPELDTGFLQHLMSEQAPQMVFEQRLPNPAAFADASPERALKVLVYREPDLPAPVTQTPSA
jgi:23S rRNA (cytosine1962-C5)-methyltransferase